MTPYPGKVYYPACNISSENSRLYCLFPPSPIIPAGRQSRKTKNPRSAGAGIRPGLPRGHSTTPPAAGEDTGGCVDRISFQPTVDFPEPPPAPGRALRLSTPAALPAMPAHFRAKSRERWTVVCQTACTFPFPHFSRYVPFAIFLEKPREPAYAGSRGLLVSFCQALVGLSRSTRSSGAGWPRPDRGWRCPWGSESLQWCR